MSSSRDEEYARWPFEDDASIRSFALRIAFEKEVSETEVGRRSWEMRRKAKLLFDARKAEEAFALFAQAAALHAPDDTSAAAAMCWYDLAETYKRRTDGVRLSNLRAAEELYRRSLRCSVVSRDPRRAAQVRNGLASCLRHLAADPRVRAEELKILEECASLFREAIDLARECGEVERETLAGYLHNLGNLEAQRGNLDAAVACLEEAGDHARRARRSEEPESLFHLNAEVALQSARVRTIRRGPGDAEEALALLQEVVRMADPRTLDQAHLAIAEVFLAMEPPHTEDAIRALRRVSFERLDSRFRPNWVDLCEGAGLRGDALRALHLEIQRIMSERAETLADRARELNLDTANVVPFARVHAASVSGRSVTELLDEVCDPIHLAAVRCWGWLSP